MSAAIEVDDLHKSYKKNSVLSGVSFTVEPGEIFALLGANGAGKTTTINILTTLLRADSGVARVCGYNVEQQPRKVRENISLTGQFAAIDEVLTARENLMLIADLRHVPNPKSVANELLDRFGLNAAGQSARPTASFSGGMKRRLDIAMSLIGDPKVVFLDEPTTGLDPQSRIEMWETIAVLAERGVSILLTTQYLEEADYLADRVAILNRGTIVASGTPHELKRLVPQGRIELRFTAADDLANAAHVLGQFETTSDPNSLTLSVQTDGSVGNVARLFGHIDEAGIEPLEFAHTIPTLDDAFFEVLKKGVPV